MLAVYLTVCIISIFEEVFYLVSILSILVESYLMANVLNTISQSVWKLPTLSIRFALQNLTIYVRSSSRSSHLKNKTFINNNNINNFK